jgi:hypothetical protein
VRKIISIFISCFLVFLSSCHLIKAESQDFSTNLHSTYTVNSNGITRVEHRFKITNLTPSYYISKYGLKLNSKNLSNIKVLDKNQELSPRVKTEGQVTTIEIEFPDKVVGERKTHDFTISFSSPDIAQVSGNVLEVTVPRMADYQNYEDYSLTLITPAQFSEPARVTPKDYDLIKSSDLITLNFGQVDGQGVSAIFGNQQIYNLDINYRLINPHNQAVISQITLPPDTSFQRVHIQNLDPKPKNVKIDKDGNWIASYKLASNSDLTIKLIAQAFLSLEPNLGIPVTEPQSFHLKPQQFWETNNNELKDLALKNQSTMEIYQTVIDTLDYTQEDLTDELPRLGASKALKNPNSVACQEFTDLFVTLARINQIPSRSITGFAYTQDNELRPLSLLSDVLHAWPEYYDSVQNLWIATDPTWGDTTQGVDYYNQFDLNHIVFAINGESSVTPYPAGSYPEGEEPQKNVQVEFAETFPNISPDFNVNLTAKKLLFFTLPGVYEIEVENITGQAWYNLDLDLKTKNLNISAELENSSIQALLPMQILKLPLIVYNSQGLLPSSEDLILAINPADSEAHEYEFKINTIPNYTKLINQPNFPFIMGGSFILATLAAGSILVLRQKRQSSLRRQGKKPKNASEELQQTPATDAPDQTTIPDSPQTKV